jgi:hypothetical protein
MSKSSQKLGDQIALEIAAHRDRYKDAAKWLDEFCSPKERLKRQKAALKKAEVEYAEEPTEGRANGISDLKRRIERREKIPLGMRLSDAVFYWLERYEGYESVSVTAEDGRRILLSALPLLQPNNETVADLLKEFGPWPWMPDDEDDEINGRAWAGMPLWFGKYGDRLKALIGAALKQVRLQDRLEALKRRRKLGKTASLIYEKLLTLPEHKAMLLPEIVQWLWDEHEINLTDSTIHQKHLNQLEPWGLQHDRRIGYSIDQNKKV